MIHLRKNRSRTAVAWLGLAALVCLGLAGCGRTSTAYDSEHEQRRNVPLARELYEKARDHRDKDPERAVELLREALSHDIYLGPAHNDLGVFLLSQGRLYDAAHEFEWARKLMPGHPDPRVNLAITLERGGQELEAMTACQTALEVQPGYLPALQVLAVLGLRQMEEPEALVSWLETIARQSNDHVWRHWATKQLLRRRSPG